jgi:hypothetical protein
MTDQELKDMLADLISSQKETDRILKESAERADAERRKADAERRKIEAELAEEHRKANAERRKIEAELAEERRRIEEELAEERRMTERVIRQVNKKLGELGNKFGSFTEGMALPSMEKILYHQFKMDVVAPRSKARQNGQTLEIDVLAYDNGSRNEAYVVEVKSHLTREGIEQMLKTIEQFPKFFGAHSHRMIYGVIAAVDIPDNLRAEVLKKGLYLARIHDGEFELLTPNNFKPAPFGPAAKQNGKAKKSSSARK